MSVFVCECGGALSVYVPCIGHVITKILLNLFKFTRKDFKQLKSVCLSSLIDFL